jgi:Cdc6-like AAA superfamily ATPase
MGRQLLVIGQHVYCIFVYYVTEMSLVESSAVAARLIRRSAANSENELHFVHTEDGVKVTSHPAVHKPIRAWGTDVRPARAPVAPKAAEAVAPTVKTLPPYAPLPPTTFQEFHTRLMKELGSRLRQPRFSNESRKFPALVGVDDAMKELREFVKGVERRGENQSLLLVGTPGSGKASALVATLQEAQAARVAEGLVPFRVVWLDGSLIEDDTAALREVSKQLSVDLSAGPATTTFGAPSAATSLADISWDDLGTRPTGDSSPMHDSALPLLPLPSSPFEDKDAAQATRINARSAAPLKVTFAPGSSLRQTKSFERVDPEGEDIFATQLADNGDSASESSRARGYSGIGGTKTSAAASRVEEEDEDPFATQADSPVRTRGAAGMPKGTPASKRQRRNWETEEAEEEEEEAEGRANGNGIYYDGMAEPALDASLPLVGFDTLLTAMEANAPRVPTEAQLKKRAGKRWKAVFAYAHELLKTVKKHGATTDMSLEHIIEKSLDQWDAVMGRAPSSSVSTADSTADRVDTSFTSDNTPADGDISDEDEIRTTKEKVQLGYINKHAHVNHLKFLVSALKDGKGANIPTFLVIQHFDVFAHASKQTFLYNVLDITASRDAHIAIVGTSTRIDVEELLEKRLKSRFSRRLLLFPRPNYTHAIKALMVAAGVPAKLAAKHPGFAAHWMAKLENTVAHPKFGLANLWRLGINMRLLIGRLLPAVQRITASDQLVTVSKLDAAMTVGGASGWGQDGSQMRLHRILDLNLIELCLLAVMAHIEKRFERDGEAKEQESLEDARKSAQAKATGALYNFRLVYHELRSDLTNTGGTVVYSAISAAMTNPQALAKKSNLGVYVPSQEVALRSYERLIEMDLVRLMPHGHNSHVPVAGGAYSPGPDAVLYTHKETTSNRDHMPYAACKLLIEASDFLKIVSEECSKTDGKKIALPTELGFWVENGGKTAPTY